MSRLKTGSPFLYDDLTDEIVGIRKPDGSEFLFSEFAKAGSGPLKNSYVGQVTTRCKTPNFKTTSNKSFMCEILVQAHERMTWFQVRLPGFMVATTTSNPTGTGQETANGGTISYRASLIKADGTVYKTTFGGSTTGVCADGSFLDSDKTPITVPVERGEFLKMRFWGQSGTGFVFTSHSGLTNVAAVGDVMNVHATAAPDLTGGGAITNNVASTCMFYPLGIYSDTTQPSLLFIGDSRVAGQADTMDSTGHIGELARCLGHRFAYTSCATPSDRAQWFITNSTNRIQLADRHSLAVIQLGINDGNNSRTSAQMLADTATLRAALKARNPNIKIFQCTLPPWATATSDAYATTGGQTIPAWSAAQRVPYNNALRGGRLANLDGFIDIADAVESARDSTFWAVPGITADGGHETQLGYLAIARSGVLTPHRLGL